MSWSNALKLLLELEGGYTFTDDPDDPGGKTYAGITLTFVEGQCPELARDFPKLLTNEQVANIYFKYFWKPSHCDVIPEPADSVFFQMTCNLGLGHAMLCLQAALSVLPDGDFGPETQRALRMIKGDELAERLLIAQATYYAAHSNPEKRGLQNRVLKVKHALWGG